MFSTCERCVVNVLLNRKASVVQHVKNIANSKKQPLISCKRKEYNFQLGQNTNNLDENNLASKGWHHKKSKGDFFIFHSIDGTQMQYFHSAFTQLGLNKTLVSKLNACSIVNPTLIQSKAIPVLLSRKNTIIAAETGCGKTLSYLLPAIQQIFEHKVINQSAKFNTPLCLILTPSRELAFQIYDDAYNLLKDSQITTDVIVGGGTKRKILNPSFKDVDLLIATPGALNKLTNAGIYKMSDVRHVILDEADTLLDESFSADLCNFLSRFPFNFSGESSSTSCQLTLVSATMPTNLPDDIANVVVPESLVRITTSGLHKLQLHVPQMFLRLNKSMKPSQLLQMVKVDTEKHYPIMIFSNKSATCDWISMFLSENGVNCINLNGDMSLDLRKNRFNNFQRGNVNVISCTDIGSRGLNTTRVKHVINYEFPKYVADYIHRCGRTGRINSPDNCQVTNFISGLEEINLVQKIEMTMRKQNCLPNVDGNIAGILQRNFFRNIRRVL